MKSKIMIITLIIFAAIGLRFVYSAMLSNKGRVRQAPEVVVDKITEGEVLPSFEAPARIVSKYQVSVLARISGY